MIRIYPSVLNGTIDAPASKAYAQRLLFASSLPPTGTVVENVPDCRDIDTCIDVLKKIGCRIERRQPSDPAFGGHASYLVEPFPKTHPMPSAKVDFRDSATTARFALAIAAAFGMNVEARALGSLSKRQMVPLTSRMAVRGMKFTNFSLPTEMTGLLEAGDYEFRGDEGSQFISSLMFALPLLASESRIRLSSPLVDPSFVEITREILDAYGIEIREDGQGFVVPGKQIYRSPGRIASENDWSIASAWVSSAPLGARRGSRVEVDRLPQDSPQLYRDIQPLTALIAQDFEDITISLESCPSLTTLVAAAALFKGAKVRLDGVPQLKAKETNRLKLMSSIINELGGRSSYWDTGIEAEGPEGGFFLEDAVIDCNDDPWIFLSFALCSSLLEKPVILKDEDCITKTYRDFFRDFESLGGRWEKI